MSYPSNGDFEVMPRGTMNELRALRSLVNNLIEISHNRSNPTEKWDTISPLIKEVEDFYSVHNEKYVL